MVENSQLRRHVLLGTHRIPAGDEDSLVYELRVEDREDSVSSQLGGDAPRYPDWVYHHVVIPRLLWEEAEEQRQAEARRQPLSSNPDLDLDLDPGDYSVRVFSTNYDFEWWRETSSSEHEEAQPSIKENNQSKCTSITNDNNLKNSSFSKKTQKKLTKSKLIHKNWSERFLEATKRREKLQEEKLARILDKIEKRNDRLQNLKK